MRRIFVAVAALLTQPAQSQPLSAVKTAELSGALYQAGLAADDPVLILAAAKLRKAMVPRAETAGTEAPLGWQEMLARAAALADGDADLLAVIDDVAAESGKGVAAGPVYSIGNLNAGDSDSYPAVAFIGGDYAEVYVEAKVTTDLNIAVYDSKGRLVCSDTDASPIAYCGWRPGTTDSFTMTVQNDGPLGATYALMTN
jgi:hypothetical protein